MRLAGTEDEGPLDLEAVIKQMGITNAILVMIPTAVTSTTIEQTRTLEKLVPPKGSIPPKGPITPNERKICQFPSKGNTPVDSKKWHQREREEDPHTEREPHTGVTERERGRIHQSSHRGGIRERQGTQGTPHKQGTPHGGNREGESENTPVVS